MTFRFPYLQSSKNKTNEQTKKNKEKNNPQKASLQNSVIKSGESLSGI